jgi:hypothetical protein
MTEDGIHNSIWVSCKLLWKLDYKTSRGIRIGDTVGMVQKAFGYLEFDGPDDDDLTYFDSLSDTQYAFMDFLNLKTIKYLQSMPLLAESQTKETSYCI